MNDSNYITVTHLCSQYNVTEQWFRQFQDTGLLKITAIEKEPCIAISNIHQVERIMRLHQDLNVNAEGIDVIFNLLEKLETLQSEMRTLEKRLRLYED